MPVHLASLLPGRKPTEGKVKRVGVAIDMKTRQVPVFIEVADGAALLRREFQGWDRGREVSRAGSCRAMPSANGSKGPFIFQIDEGHAKRVLVNVLGSVGKNSIHRRRYRFPKRNRSFGQLPDRRRRPRFRPEEAAPAEEDEDED